MLREMTEVGSFLGQLLAFSVLLFWVGGVSALVFLGASRVVAVAKHK